MTRPAYERRLRHLATLQAAHLRQYTAQAPTQAARQRVGSEQFGQRLNPMLGSVDLVRRSAVRLMELGHV